MSSLGLLQRGESARLLTLFLRTAERISGVLAESEG
jgi:hypothetical protein